MSLLPPALVAASGTGRFWRFSAKTIRLCRKGCTNRPFYQIVVMEVTKIIGIENKITKLIILNQFVETKRPTRSSNRASWHLRSTAKSKQRATRLNQLWTCSSLARLRRSHLRTGSRASWIVRISPHSSEGELEASKVRCANVVILVSSLCRPTWTPGEFVSDVKQPKKKQKRPARRLWGARRDNSTI